MTTNLSYDPVLGRVLISLSGWADGTVRIERSLNAAASDAIWAQGLVRGGRNLPVVGGAATLSDYDGWAPDVTNHYRVRASSWEDMVQIFTSSGTWTKPSGLVAVKVTVAGAGGAGGGSAATGASDRSVGGGGAYGGIVVGWIPAADLGSTETVTVGTGGTGVSGLAGNNGGQSIFTRTTGTDLTANGGAGGSVVTATTDFVSPSVAAGGSGTGGDLVVPGAAGSWGLTMHSVSNLTTRGGDGANGPFGAGGAGGRADVGGAASGRGAGGGGASGRPSEAARAGGNGAPGVVIVEHYFDEIGV